MNIRLDHCVIHVSNWERSNVFYRDVMGAELVKVGAGPVGHTGSGIHNSIVTARTWMVTRWRNSRSCLGAATCALSGPARSEPPLPICRTTAFRWKRGLSRDLAHEAEGPAFTFETPTAH